MGSYDGSDLNFLRTLLLPFYVRMDKTTFLSRGTNQDMVEDMPQVDRKVTYTSQDSAQIKMIDRKYFFSQ